MKGFATFVLRSKWILTRTRVSKVRRGLAVTFVSFSSLLFAQASLLLARKEQDHGRERLIALLIGSLTRSLSIECVRGGGKE